MKKILIAVIAAFSMFGASGVIQAAPVTASIQFTGYCDGMTITYDMVTGYASGLHTGSCVLPDDPAIGSAGKINGQNAVTLTYSDPFFTGLVTLIIRANGTLTMLQSDNLGGSIWLTDATWNVGVPAAVSANLPLGVK